MCDLTVIFVAFFSSHARLPIPRDVSLSIAPCPASPLCIPFRSMRATMTMNPRHPPSCFPPVSPIRIDWKRCTGPPPISLLRMHIPFRWIAVGSNRRFWLDGLHFREDLAARTLGSKNCTQNLKVVEQVRGTRGNHRIRLGLTLGQKNTIPLSSRSWWWRL